MPKSWKRPKILIPKTMSEKIWDIIGYFSLIGTNIFLLSVWNKLPEKVPAHYNALGEVDRWGGKWELSILSFISILLLLMMQFFEKHPEWHNYPSRFNESNAESFYLLSRRFMNLLKNLCILVLQTIQLQTILVALEWFGGFGAWFLPSIIIIVLLPIIVMIIKQRRIK